MKNWDSMTRSKKEDGFGFRLLESFNNALLVKMEAMIISKLDALWVRGFKRFVLPLHKLHSNSEGK